MQKKLNQSEAKGTGLVRNRFRTARLRLTVLYAVLLAVILGISSVVTYLGFSQRLERGPIGIFFQHVEPSEGHDSPGEEKDELLEVLFLSNGFLLVVAVGLSYWLAGETLRPIQESYEQQRRFLGDVSHELRTPLAILKTNIENEVYRSAKTAKEVPSAAVNLEEVDRMSAMVTDLLTLSRLDELESIQADGQQPLMPIIKDVVERLQPLAASHHVVLTLEENSTFSAEVGADKELFSQALSNVIKNGIFYNTEGGSVTVSAAATREEAVVSIVDTGVGIAEDDLAHIFERFYRADKSRSRQTGGSGLGLAITQTVLKQLHGSVKIKSTPGKGTTVRLVLPIATPR